MRQPAYAIAIALLGCAVLAWNAARFQETRQRPRAKDLDFLPPPAVAQALSLGQGTAVAKLRWIDSFAYFQYQLDRLDDRVAGKDGRGGFERLYETLLVLDPLFMPFYEHAVLTTSGVLKRPHAAIALLMRGLLEMPHETTLWRMASAEMAVSLGWTRSNPAQLDRWLQAWADSESTPEGRQLVMDWRRGLAFASVEGVEMLNYWLQQLGQTRSGTAHGDYVEGMVRELLAEYGARQLAGMLRTSEHPVPGTLGPILAEPLLPLLSVNLDHAKAAARWPHGAPPFAPIAWDGRAVELRPDPFGYPWTMAGGRVISMGREQRRFLQRVQGARNGLAEESRHRGRPPRDQAEAEEWGYGLPDPPYDGRWSFAGAMPDVVWPDPPHPPWRLR